MRDTERQQAGGVLCSAPSTTLGCSDGGGRSVSGPRLLGRPKGRPAVLWELMLLPGLRCPQGSLFSGELISSCQQAVLSPRNVLLRF